MPLLRPRAFISYRHTEYEDTPNADALNAEHCNWVHRFAHDLDACGVEPVYDEVLRQVFPRHSAGDPFTAPFMAEISTITCLICHAFVPVLTLSYLDRIGHGDYELRKATRVSYAQEEWQFGLHFSNIGALQYVPIIRNGEPERMAALPLGVGPDNTFDMRDPQHYPQQVRFIAQRILEGWDGDDPLLKVDVKDWMQLYIGWCRENYPGCAEKPVDEWQMDLLRPRLFVNAIFEGVKSRMG